ncbi:hypothetical protein [Polaromonas sp.]|uniref:hypothetical protein n=1 Tax=Polaromonas sp. TaxID=1869339 RepID=UPI002735792D|nr:hypothetical protein [Polaromonas sp.]
MPELASLAAGRRSRFPRWMLHVRPVVWDWQPPEAPIPSPGEFSSKNRLLARVKLPLNAID